MEVMLVGATRGVFLAVDRMSKTKGGEGGRIINTASMAGVSVSYFTIRDSTEAGQKSLFIVKLFMMKVFLLFF